MGIVATSSGGSWAEIKDDEERQRLRGDNTPPLDVALELQPSRDGDDGDGGGGGGAGERTYKVYKRRWFGLAQLTLLNIIVSWDVSCAPSLAGYLLTDPIAAGRLSPPAVGCARRAGELREEARGRKRQQVAGWLAD